MTHAPPLLTRFIRSVEWLTDEGLPEAEFLAAARPFLAALVGEDDWLPAAYAEPHPERYRQYLLYRDPDARFSLVSFVWGPGQSTPIHDHTVWGLVGVLRGAELSQRFQSPDVGPPEPLGQPERLEPGAVEAVSPAIGDVHQVWNAFEDRVSISIHLYGADIGAVRRWTYPVEGGRKSFVSGYDNTGSSPAFFIESEERAA